MSRPRAVCVAIAAALAVAACGADTDTDPDSDSDTEPDQAGTTVPALAPTTTAELSAPVTTAVPAPTTAVPDERAPATTETQPGAGLEPPQITIWSTPRLHGTTLRASWQVTPVEAQCTYDLRNVSGDVIGTGVADIAGSDDRGRGLRAEYDPGTAESLGSVVIRCTHLGAPSDPAEFPVHRVNYQNRSENSVIPATDAHYFDHNEIRALFGDCPLGKRLPTNELEPIHMVGKVEDLDGDGWVSVNDWLNTGLDFWESVFENWDTDTHNINGKEVASGWWTNKQLRMYFPDGGVTADSARQAAFYNNTVDLLWIGGESSVNIDWVTGPLKYIVDGRAYYAHSSLYRRLESTVGFVSEHPGSEAPWDIRARWIADDGLLGHDPNPPRVVSAELLWDWMDTRHSFVPVDKEPTAWAMRTLLEARDSECVAGKTREHCESGDFHSSPHMRHPNQGGSRLGAVLWSAVCPEITP